MAFAGDMWKAEAMSGGCAGRLQVSVRAALSCATVPRPEGGAQPAADAALPYRRSSRPHGRRRRAWTRRPRNRDWHPGRRILPPWLVCEASALCSWRGGRTGWRASAGHRLPAESMSRLGISGAKGAEIRGDEVDGVRRIIRAATPTGSRAAAMTAPWFSSRRRRRTARGSGVACALRGTDEGRGEEDAGWWLS